MPSPRVLILRAPGTNCDMETAHAFELAGGRPDVVHVNRWLESPQLAQAYQILCLPGGFSYGDDVSAGRILALQLTGHLSDALRQFHADGKLILGICNGFQVLIKTGLFDGGGPDRERGATPPAPATLTWNDSGRFVDRWVPLRTVGERCVFLQGIERMFLPIAHAEGKFVARDQATLDALDQGGQLVLRYDTSAQAVGGNPNGSQRDVAGICDPTGRVLGLMPHPERYVDPTHHPQWTRRGPAAEGEGLAVFRNAVDFF
jgi:phosphoribosylformylglycinamidine synthase